MTFTDVHTDQLSKIEHHFRKNSTTEVTLNKVSPFDGLNGDKNYYSKIDFGCNRECKRTHYKMDITVGDVDLIPFQKYVESGQNTSINASKL